MTTLISKLLPFFVTNDKGQVTQAVITSSKMCLIFQGIRLQVQVLKPCKSIQKSSKEVLDFKTRQLARQIASIEV